MERRPVWQGSLQFGLVTIPVGLYPAESPDDLNLDLLDRRDMGRVGYAKINKGTGEAVPDEEVVKGYEIQDGRYVVVTESDIRSASPRATRTIEVVGFVDADAIAPIYFDRPYYVAPLEHGTKPFALLRAALERSKRIGIARVVVRTREYVAAVYPWERALVVHLLRYAHELRDPAKLALPPALARRPGSAAGGRELEMAEKLIEGMADDWDPDAFHDQYRKKLLALIRRKAKAGKKWRVPEVETAEPAGEVVDLMALLKRSVEARGGTRRATARRRAARAHAAQHARAGRHRGGSRRRSA